MGESVQLTRHLLPGEALALWYGAVALTREFAQPPNPKRVRAMAEADVVLARPCVGTPKPHWRFCMQQLPDEQQEHETAEMRHRKLRT